MDRDVLGANVGVILVVGRVVGGIGCVDVFLLAK